MAPQVNSDIALDLALAVIESSTAPLLLLDSDFTILAASRSFCTTFRLDPAAVANRKLSELGEGEWNIPQLLSLLKATGSGFAEVQGYEMPFKRDNHDNLCLVLNAHKLNYVGDSLRLLLTISDVTEARNAQKENDDLLNEKAVLLHELHHRVANSLQIIASVLMQSARKVQSDETRTHLFDAHHRVMSVAALQHQLAGSSTADVALEPYFTALCESIGASMIRDHNQLSIDVSVDKSSTLADTSVSLGLIVTELVINALKHAFPCNRNGMIKVEYSSRGPNWTLSVTDNGVGMPENSANAKPGLGTNIVQALAKQLKAKIKVADAGPGTSVQIAHTQITAVGEDAGAIELAV